MPFRMHRRRKSLSVTCSIFRHLDRPMNDASNPRFSFFCFLPMRESFRLLPAVELIAALMDFFLTLPLTRFPMVDSKRV